MTYFNPDLGRGLGKFIICTLVLIAIVAFLVGYTIADNSVKVISFQYAELDDYYLECLSYHDGTGKVLIRTDGTYELSCADGTTFKGGE